MTPGEIVLVVFCGVMMLRLVLRTLQKPCNHTWEVKDKTTIPAPIIAWKANTSDSMTGYCEPNWEAMSTEKVTTVLVCTKCGKLRVVRS